MLAPAFLGSGWTAHPLLPGRLRFDMVDRLLEGQPLELKLRFSERRIAVAQPSNKSFARPGVEGKASLNSVRLQRGDSVRDHAVITAPRRIVPRQCVFASEH